MLGLDRDSAQNILLFLIVWSFFAGVGVIVGRKKGVSAPVAILGSFPLWVALFAMWLVRKPDVRAD